MNTENPNSNKIIPAIPDFDALPGKYDEPRIERKLDQMPKGNIQPLLKGNRAGSKAILRLRVEELLHRREAPTVEAWKELGDAAMVMLQKLVSDRTLKEVVRQRVMATLGQLGIKQSISQLGEIALNASESAISRTYAVSALAHMDDEQVIPLLGKVIADKNEMVRLQVARALSRIKKVEVIPYLLSLRDDSVPEIANLATKELDQTYGNQLKTELKIKPAETETVDEKAAKLNPLREQKK